MDYLIISDYKNEFEEIMTGIDYGSFSYEYEKNSKRTITFTMYNTNKSNVSYALAINEAKISYHDQIYIIKTVDETQSGNLLSKVITAYHVMFSIQDFVAEKKYEGTKTYSIKDVIDLCLKNNEIGFNFAYSGDFPKVQIENLGEINGMATLNLIADKFGAIYFADNKNVTFYSEEKFYIPAEKTFRYQYNTDNVKVTTDTTTLKTYVHAYGKVKEDNKGYFAEVIYKSPNISEYGIRMADPISDERFTDVNALNDYAKTQIQDVPETSLTLNYTQTEAINERELWYFIHEKMGYETDVKLVSLNKGHEFAYRVPTLTFNNSKKDMIKIQRSIATNMKNQVKKLDNVSKNAQISFDSRIIREVVGTVDTNRTAKRNR